MGRFIFSDPEVQPGSYKVVAVDMSLPWYHKFLATWESVREDDRVVVRGQVVHFLVYASGTEIKMHVDNFEVVEEAVIPPEYDPASDPVLPFSAVVSGAESRAERETVKAVEAIVMERVRASVPKGACCNKGG